MRRYLPLVCLALLHTIVDTSALLVSPLWNELTVECQLVGSSLVGPRACARVTSEGFRIPRVNLAS